MNGNPERGSSFIPEGENGDPENLSNFMKKNKDDIFSSDSESSEEGGYGPAITMVLMTGEGKTKEELVNYLLEDYKEARDNKFDISEHKDRSDRISTAIDNLIRSGTIKETDGKLKLAR